MSTSTHTPRRAATVRISAQRARVARALLIVAAFGAAIATVGAIGTASDADAATRVVETWRLLGLGVFTGLFVLLAYRPRYYAGVWELAIANKFALAAFGIAYGADATDARQILAFDGAIAILLVAAYVLSRGWRAWSSVRMPSSSTAP